MPDLDDDHLLAYKSVTYGAGCSRYCPFSLFMHVVRMDVTVTSLPFISKMRSGTHTDP